MMNTRKILFVLIFILLSNFITAQDTILGLPLITNYSYLEYHAHYQNFNAVQTDDGLMLFANGNGVLTFDGVNWNTIKIPNDLTCRVLMKDEKGNIFVGGDKLFGKLIADSRGRLKYVSLMDKIPENYRNFYSIWHLFTYNDIIYALTSKFVFIIKPDTTTVIPLKRDIYGVFKDSKNRIFVITDTSFSQIVNDSLRDYSFNGAVLDFYQSNDTTFFVDLRGNIYFLDKNNTATYLRTLSKKFDTSVRNVYYCDNKYLIFTSASGISIYNKNGRFLEKIDKRKGLISDNVYFIFVDKIGNLWVGTDFGLSYVELNSPIRIFDSRLGIQTETYSFSSMFNSRMYYSSGFNLYSFKLNSQNFQLHHLSDITGQLWSSVIVDSDMYIARNPGILKINKDEKIKIYGPRVNVWKILRVSDRANNYLLGTSNGLYLYNYNGDSLKFVKKIKKFDDNSRELIIDKNGNLWVGGNPEGVYRLKFDNNFNIISKKFYGKSKGLPNTSSIMFFKWHDTLLISIYKTLYFYDNQKDTICEFKKITNKFDHSGQKILQLVGVDKFDNLWFEYYDDNYNFNVIVLKETKGKFVEIMPYSRRLQNFSVVDVQNFSGNIDLIGTMRGLVAFNIFEATKMKLNKFNAFVANVSLIDKDSNIFEGFVPDSNRITFGGKKVETIEFPYRLRNLRFNCASDFYVEPQKTMYRYLLVNYDKTWSKWTFETKKEYTNLPPGHFIFKVQAKNIYGQLSNPDYISIYISYPWYLTIYAYIAYLILAVLFILAIVKYYTYSLQKKNEKLEEIVKERTSEILQKNVELEQQKEEILTQSEELMLVNQELQKLSTIARETDNAVILADKEGNFIWVNSAFTKIFGYTFDELVNDVSKNIISEKTDPEIKKLIKRCLEQKVTVEYELKVRNKFNKEIWVHTTLTPILGENDEVESLVAIDSDITDLKIAEKQITEQRDQITSSIRYARTIQESILPKLELINNLFDSFIIFKPKDIVSGDLYWMSNILEKKEDKIINSKIDETNSELKTGQSIFVAVVDCTGHGVPGAFMSLIANNMLRLAINEEKLFSPKEVLKRMDLELSRILSRSQTKNYDGMVLSLCRIDKISDEKYKIVFAGAKQYISYYSFVDSEMKKIKGSVRQIGFVMNDKIDFDQKEFELNTGDYLFIYSDGLKDLNDKKRRSFGYSRIKRIVENNITKGIKEIEQNLVIEIDNWLDGEKQRDDITFWGLRLK